MALGLRLHRREQKSVDETTMKGPIFSDEKRPMRLGQFEARTRKGWGQKKRLAASRTCKKTVAPFRKKWEGREGKKRFGIAGGVFERGSWGGKKGGPLKPEEKENGRRQE